MPRTNSKSSKAWAEGKRRKGPRLAMKRKATPKTRRPIKANKKASRSARKAARPVHMAEAAEDVESLLIKDLLSEGAAGTPGVQLHTLLYNSSPSMAAMAYRHGFSVGRHAYADNPDIKAMLHLLDKACLGRMLYYPSRSSPVVKAKGGPAPYTGRSMHSYESGIIAGYLSSFLGTPMHVRETRCMHNGSKFCQFVAEPGPEPVQDTMPIPTFSVIRSMESYMTGIYGIARSEESGKYSFLSIMPILEHSLLKKASALLFFAGKDIGKQQHSASAATISGMAAFLGISEAKIIKDARTKFSIELRYAAYNSANNFVEISVPMFLGFLGSAFGMASKVNKREAKSNGYIVVLSVDKQV